MIKLVSDTVIEAGWHSKIYSAVITLSIGTPYLLTILILKFEIVYSTTS